MIAYSNAIVHSEGSTFNKTIVVDRDIIVDLIDSPEGGNMEVVNLAGHHLAPAFIDLQIYGGNGKMFSQELSEKAIQSTYQYCLQGGCGYFMITMATNTVDNFLKGIEAVRRYWVGGGKGLLGLHLEGPYLNPIKKGAHKEEWIKRPDAEEVKLLLNEGKDVVKMMTIAPEMCEENIISLLLQNNILVSAGHTNATYQQGMTAFDLGIPAATHLFNAMSAFQSREPGMVGAIYDHGKVASSIVCDGVHVDFAAVRVSKKLMGNRLFFITDAVTEIKHGPYHHLFRGDRYTLPDGTLSGSCLTMMQCVKNGVEKVGLSLAESLSMATDIPASLIQRKIGKVEVGYEASFVVFDDDFNVKRILASP